MAGKKNSVKKNEPGENNLLRRFLKQELMKWYCDALYSGKVKASKNNSTCSEKKAL